MALGPVLTRKMAMALSTKPMPSEFAGPVLARTTSENMSDHVPPKKSQRPPASRRSVSADARLVGDIAKAGRVNPILPTLGVLVTLRKVVVLYARLQVLFAFPGKWLVQFVRLMGFVMLMLPGLLPPFFTYLTSKRITKNIPYRSGSFRHQLDVYLPDGGAAKAPVVIFVSGGAWIIGYKMWGWIMGQVFQKQGVLFIAPDYRNFPETTASGMVDDVADAVGFILENIETLGGDPENVTLMGQSAGAHLTALMLVERAEQEAVHVANGTPCQGWKLSSLKSWVGISGPYDIVQVMPTMRNRGLPSRVISALMGNDLPKSSPTWRVRDLAISETKGALALLPTMNLFHGTADETVTWHQSQEFSEALSQGGVSNRTKYYMDKSHTDPILEDPCDGDGDELMVDLLNLVQPGNHNDSELRIRSFLPKFMLRWAKVCNPF